MVNTTLPFPSTEEVSTGSQKKIVLWEIQLKRASEAGLDLCANEEGKGSLPAV